MRYKRKGRGVTPQYVLKPRLTVHKPVNPPFSNNFRQRLFMQTGSGRRRFGRPRRRRGGKKEKKKASILGELHAIAKQHKFASRAANYVKNNGPEFLKSYADRAHKYFKSQGYGRRRRHRRKRGGLNAQQSSYLNAFKTGYKRGGRRRRRRLMGKIRGFRHLGVPSYGPARVIGNGSKAGYYGKIANQAYSSFGVHGKNMGGRRRHRIRHRRRRGGSWIGDRLGELNNTLKRTKLLSKAGHFASNLLPPGYSHAGHIASDIADKLGYGRRRVHRRGGSNPYPNTNADVSTMRGLKF